MYIHLIMTTNLSNIASYKLLHTPLLIVHVCFRIFVLKKIQLIKSLQMGRQTERKARDNVVE